MHSLFIVENSVRGWFNTQMNTRGNRGNAIADLNLSVTGTKPGTHGWCALQMKPAQVATMQALLAANPSRAIKINWTQYDIGTSPNWPFLQLASQGLKQIVEKPKL